MKELAKVEFGSQKLLASSQTLYFLFKIRRARVTKNKPREIYWPPAQRGIFLSRASLSCSPRSRARRCSPKERKETWNNVCVQAKELWTASWNLFGMCFSTMNCFQELFLVVVQLFHLSFNFLESYCFSNLWWSRSCKTRVSKTVNSKSSSALNNLLFWGSIIPMFKSK